MNPNPCCFFLSWIPLRSLPLESPKPFPSPLHPVWATWPHTTQALSQFLGPGMWETWPRTFHQGGSGFPPERPAGGTAWQGALGLFSGPLVTRVIKRIGVWASPLAFSSQAQPAGCLLVTSRCSGNLPGLRRLAGELPRASSGLGVCVCMRRRGSSLLKD